MEEKKKVIQIGLLIILILAASVGIYYFLNKRSKTKGAAENALQVSSPPPAEETTGSAGLEPLVLPPLELDKSDDVLRQIARDISSQPQFFEWIKTSELIRKFVAAVDNIANGYTPRAQIDFFHLTREFKVVKKEGRPSIDPASYDRYNAVADVFISLDSKDSARLYLALKPLLQQAYKELGYPDEDFQDTLVRATAELLRTPVVEGNVPLESKVSSYAFADQSLEELSDVQKQFLRMGPDNMQVIQTKLRELALAAGISEYRLPKPVLHAPSRGR